MSSLRRWITGAGCLLVLTGTSLVFAQDADKGKAREPKSFRRQLHHSLTLAHNRGALLYNSGDWAGCYRLFEGSLITVKPLLSDHPDLQKKITDSLTLAEAAPSLADRAWILRDTLLKVREAFSEKRSGDKVVDKPEDRPRPGTEDGHAGTEDKSAAPKKTLWDRLGGEKGVARIVDDLVTTAVRDPKVNFFRGNKYKVDAAGMNRIKQHMIQQASALTGGPLPYEGESMKQTHKGMGITDSELDAFMGHVKDALAKNKVNATDAATILSALNSKRKDIVEEKKPAEQPTPKPADQPGGKDGKKSNVHGKIALQGQPVTKGEVAFHPDAGASVTGKIGQNGDYSVQLAPGKYRITVKGEKPAVPAKYGDAKTSPLACEVKETEQILDFLLQ